MGRRRIRRRGQAQPRLAAAAHDRRAGGCRSHPDLDDVRVALQVQHDLHLPPHAVHHLLVPAFHEQRRREAQQYAVSHLPQRACAERQARRAREARGAAQGASRGDAAGRGPPSGALAAQAASRSGFSHLRLVLAMDLTQNTSPVSRSVHSYTTPKTPLPSWRPMA